MEAKVLVGVGEVLRAAAKNIVLPHFAAYGKRDCEWKAAGEPVTAADRRAEAMISTALLELLPHARVVGEEACAAEPSLLKRLDEGMIWIVDPIDGTANFADGRAPFAIMVALLK